MFFFFVCVMVREREKGRGDSGGKRSVGGGQETGRGGTRGEGLVKGSVRKLSWLVLYGHPPFLGLIFRKSIHASLLQPSRMFV